MRKITLILMILSIAFLVPAISYAKNAQHTARIYPPVKEGWRLTDSAVSVSPLQDDSWKYDYRFTYEYSSDFPQKPNRINYQLFDYQGKWGWGTNKSYFITYDSEGRLLHMDAEGFPDKYNQCYYDDDGRLIQMDNSWYYGLNTLTVTYNEGEIWVQGDGQNEFKITVNENWEITSKKWFALDYFDEWEEQYTEEFQYHPQNNSSFREFQDWLAYLLANMHLKIQQNDSEVPGLCTQKLRGRYDDDNFVLGTKTTWDYDDALKALESKTFQWTDVDWELTHETEYEYDAEDLLSLETHKHNFYGTAEMLPFRKIEHNYETYVSIEDEIESPALALDISLWPMPFRENVNIRIDSKDLQQTSLEVYNLKGQLICKPYTMGNNQITWDGKDAQGRDLPNGVYFLKAISGKDVATKKMIKLR